jgi:hypothetical protein
VPDTRPLPEELRGRAHHGYGRESEFSVALIVRGGASNRRTRRQTLSRWERRRLLEGRERTEAGTRDEERDWDESARSEHRPFPLDAPEADALDQERAAPLGDDDHR